jgi:hypothetical protein
MDIDRLKYTFNNIIHKYEELEIKINDINTENINKKRMFNTLIKKINLEFINFENKLEELNLEIDEFGSNINLVNLESKIVDDIKEHNLNKKVFKKFLIPMLIYKKSLLNNN